MKRDDHVLIRATVFDTPDQESDKPIDRFYTFAIEPVASAESGRELVSVYERDVDKVIANTGRENVVPGTINQHALEAAIRYGDTHSVADELRCQHYNQHDHPCDETTIAEIAQWAVEHRHDAAVYPVGTVVATADTVYIKDGGSAEPTLPWRDVSIAAGYRMYSNISSDDAVRAVLVDGTATVLRVGSGE